MLRPPPPLARAARAFACVAGLLAPPALALQEAPERALSAESRGKVYASQASNGLRYEYYVPKDYDPERGANLTLVLHGSNLDRRWGFANHAAGEFRARDVVVCPDGTTSNGQGGFNSLQSEADLERLHVLHEELRAALKLRATYIYGHSQGSFFAFYYAGHYPDDVQGLVGQASGVWIGTETSKKGHHQAIVLMHGTQDPVVPYGQSEGGYEAYSEAKYLLLRLRSLEGWNHWPNQAQTEQELAWCEAMTSGDPDALVACFDALERVKEGRDPVALHQVARRLIETETVDGRDRERAQKALDEVEKLAAEHAAAIEQALGKSKGTKLEDAAWVGHLPLFLRQFRGIPACDALRARFEKALEKQAEDATRCAREYWRLRDTKPADALDAGIELVEKAFLTSSASDEEFLKKLEAWRSDRSLELAKSKQKQFDAAVPVLRSALAKGRKAYDGVSREFL